MTHHEELPFGPDDYLDDEDEDICERTLKLVVLCQHCRYRDTEECQWRNDVEPFGSDYCSYGELKTKY